MHPSSNIVGDESRQQLYVIGYRNNDELSLCLTIATKR